MKKIAILFSIFYLLLSSNALAHGLVTTQTKQVGQYGIEFEYNTIGNVVAGDYTLFDVYLVNPDDLSSLDYDSSFVKITKKDGPVVFTANLATSKDIKGYAGFSTAILEPGVYVASTNFMKAGLLITQADFEFTVDASTFVPGSSTSHSPSIWMILAIGLGVILIYKVTIAKTKR